MKALFVGLGSIGVRHLKNLAALCRERGLALEAVALRSSARALPEEAAALLARQQSGLAAGETFDVAFITNPTQLHAQVLAALKGRVGTFFIEKPIFEAAGYDLAALGLCKEQKAYVAAPMRWCGVYLALKKKIEEGLRVYSVRALCSSYLPDWRKGADYREVYSAKRSMGGGVTLDLIHEWDYLTDLFGMPGQSCHYAGHFSHLEIDSDDLSVYIARYRDFLCELHLDYFGRGYQRYVELYTREGTLRADFGSGVLTLAGGGTEDHAEEANRRYEREMAYFLDYAISGEGESCNSPGRALAVLQLALGER